MLLGRSNPEQKPDSQIGNREMKFAAGGGGKGTWFCQKGQQVDMEEDRTCTRDSRIPGCLDPRWIGRISMVTKLRWTHFFLSLLLLLESLLHLWVSWFIQQLCTVMCKSVHSSWICNAPHTKVPLVLEGVRRWRAEPRSAKQRRCFKDGGQYCKCVIHL